MVTGGDLETSLARDDISNDLGVTGGDLETSLGRTRDDTSGAPDLSINNCSFKMLFSKVCLLASSIQEQRLDYNLTESYYNSSYSNIR